MGLYCWQKDVKQDVVKYIKNIKSNIINKLFLIEFGVYYSTPRLYSFQ